ncbi:uncharacterized protein LOC119953866 isoform X2 [Scyliorhinus canicula]|uniref:uncharacterized protein LOC119953866 isoform X2 n=1 Tax=Scyliorhinus canicula TaxID=7830 RepID=UPI0018F63CB5|nr:uncharacterized protein LOC119953866 isoform X2 [Scyliorhinus canicula]
MIVSIWLVYLLGEATYDWGASFIGKNKSQAGSSPKKGWEVGPGPQVSHSEAGALHTESQDLPPHVRPGGGLESQASGSEARKLSTDPQDLRPGGGLGPQASGSEAGALLTDPQDLTPQLRPGGGLGPQASGSEAGALLTDPQDLPPQLYIHKRAVGVATRIDPGTCSPTGSDPNSGSYPRSSLDVICNANAPSRSERDCPKRAPKKKCTPD